LGKIMRHPTGAHVRIVGFLNSSLISVITMYVVKRGEVNTLAAVG
jgi:hypothetical protein